MEYSFEYRKRKAPDATSGELESAPDTLTYEGSLSNASQNSFFRWTPQVLLYGTSTPFLSDIPTMDSTIPAFQFYPKWSLGINYQIVNYDVAKEWSLKSVLLRDGIYAQGLSTSTLACHFVVSMAVVRSSLIFHFFYFFPLEDFPYCSCDFL